MPPIPQPGPITSPMPFPCPILSRPSPPANVSAYWMKPKVVALHHSQCLLVMIAPQHCVSLVLRSSGCNIFRRNTKQAASSALFRTVEHFSFVCGLMIRQLVQALLTLLYCVTHYALPWSTCRNWLHRTPLQRGTKQRVSPCKVCIFLLRLGSCIFKPRDNSLLSF